MGSWNKTMSNLSEIIPKTILEGYRADYIFLTTFSLDLEQLTEILYELDALQLVGQDRIKVFYDACDRTVYGLENQVISEKHLVGIKKIENNRELYAFHPKVILLRYVKDGCEPRYVLLVMSKNITKSILLDAYVLLYGDVNKSSSESVNGKHISLFFEGLFANVTENLDFSLTEELRTIRFGRVSNDEEINFYNGREVWEKIKDKRDLMIVSPFLSNSLINEIGVGNISKIVSTIEGFARLDETVIKSMIDKQKCYFLLGDNLHAKIYCWQENGKTMYIIGSSNATANGCNISSNSFNIEYNVGFSDAAKGYEELLAQASSEMFMPLQYLDYLVKKESLESNHFPARYYYNLFCNGIDKIECWEEKKIYSYEFSFKKEIAEYQEKYGFQIEIRTLTAEYQKINSEKIVLKSEYPLSTMYVKVSDLQGESREFCYSLYMFCLDSEKIIMDAQCKKNYLDLLTYLQKQCLKGHAKAGRKNLAAIPDGQPYKRTKNAIEKEYVYEQIMKLSQRCHDKQQLKANLLEISKLSTEILSLNLAGINDIKEQQEEFKKMSESILTVIDKEEIYE